MQYVSGIPGFAMLGANQKVLPLILKTHLPSSYNTFIILYFKQNVAS